MNNVNEYELYHFGTKGMKWGVRRYQNKDGTLTDAGKKRYDKMSDGKLYRTLNKQVKKKRGEIHGSANRWMHDKPIGKNSEKVIRDRLDAMKKWKNTEEYADALKQQKAIEKQWPDVVSGKMSESAWQKQYDNASKYFEGYMLDNGWAKIGNTYTKKYLKGVGKDMTVAHLKDLGYDNDTTRQFADRLVKSGKVLGGL